MTFDLGADSTKKSLFPALPLDEWDSIKETLHRFAQTVGKVRLACCAPLNPLVECRPLPLLQGVEHRA
jgi:hypothetical protein